MDSDFWWNWGVQVAVAVGTFAAAFVALFGTWLRAKLFRPRLELSLTAEFGEATVASITGPSGAGDGSQATRALNARYYHALVTNTGAARWPVATDVQVFVVRIEEKGPDGTLQVKWAGDAPLRWRHQEVHPLTRTVGSPKDCDLCGVYEGKGVSLLTVVMPTNLAPFANFRLGPLDMVVSIQAKANEGESPVTRFQISWDGLFAAGEREMAQHFIVRRLL